uniref:Uncharacterized protein n=1 Tax=Megaselia scalaris TaxID=36166 RepID=T1H492_MEGSC
MTYYDRSVFCPFGGSETTGTFAWHCMNFFFKRGAKRSLYKTKSYDRSVFCYFGGSEATALQDGRG